MKVFVYRFANIRRYDGRCGVAAAGVPEYDAVVAERRRQAPAGRNMQRDEYEIEPDAYRLLQRFHRHHNHAYVTGGYYVWDEIRHLFEAAGE